MLVHVNVPVLLIKGQYLQFLGLLQVLFALRCTGARSRARLSTVGSGLSGLRKALTIMSPIFLFLLCPTIIFQSSINLVVAVEPRMFQFFLTILPRSGLAGLKVVIRYTIFWFSLSDLGLG